MIHEIETIGVEGLAKALQKEPSTIYMDVSRRPESLPPRLLIPNSNRLVWRVKDVAEWMEERKQKPVGRPRRVA